jgi:signal transduction histidine kinase
MARWWKSVLAGIFAAAACLGLLGWVNAREMASRERDLLLESNLTALQISGRMQGGLREHFIALGQVANFWANSQDVTEQEFHNFASQTFKLTPLCFRISVIDPTLHVRWVYPPGPNQFLVGFDVKTHPEGLETLLRAEQTRSTALSQPLKLVGGSQGFVLTTPLFRNGKFLGAVVCSFLSSHFFESRILSEVAARYDLVVLDSGVPLFTSGESEASRFPNLPVIEKLELGGRTWETRVRPRDAVVLERLHSDRAGFWMLGCILALLSGGAAGVLTHYATGTRLRLEEQGQTLVETRHRLDGATQQLLQAEKIAALGELVAGVAHEVNNPLASIMGYSQLALTQELTPTVRRYIETACSEAERAGKIVRNLLTFARKQKPEMKYLGLNGIIEKTLDLKAYHFRTSQIQVEKELETDLPKTMLDYHQLQQVILNLLNNSEQAMLEAGRGGTIRVQTARVGERLEVRVSDDGPGISPDIQVRIFEPFFTTKQEGKGTGLGLSLCFGIVHEHGGTIRVESEPGKGATFVIDLPIVEEPSIAPVAITGVVASSVPRLRVLVIDDEPNMQGFLADLLRAKGHGVDTAADVPEALRKIAGNGHNLIITDMKMPRGTGKDIYNAVMEKSPHLARRIIFTTGDGASDETQKFVRDTGNEIVLKPFKIDELEKAIAATLSN